MKDIETLEDIQLMVDTFYGKVRQDDLLGDIFEAVVQGRWEKHLNKMYSFWQTVLLEERSYFGRPFPPHMVLPIEKQHFDRWLALFEETVQTLFEGEKALEARWRAGKMAEMFLAKLTYYRNHSANPLI